MKKILLLAFFFCISLHINAQTTLPGACEVWLPRNIDKEVIRKSDALRVASAPYGQSPAPSRKSYWIVFSDRDNNTTYTSPRNGASVYSSLSFNERLIIASIKDGYALVYSEPKTERYPYISSAAKSRGWVPMTRLLLWSKGVADNADVLYKAVICANIDAQGNNAEGKLFKSPNGKSVGNLKTDMKFYFIMKEEGNKVLLGYYAALPTNESRGLYGWVDKNSFVPWNQRTCLEPTWDKSTVEWLAANKKKWQVFYYENMSKCLKEDMFTSKKRTDVPYEYIYRHMPAQYLRFPILEGCTSNKYYCSSFGTLGKTVSTVNVDEETRELMDRITDIETINIGIVIDGTNSMKPYFASVKNAIMEGCKYFGNQKVNIAVAIYRDKGDRANGKEYVFEYFPWTNANNQNLKSWLDRGGEYGVRSIVSGETESMYYGIKSAIEKLNFNPKQSNLLLVVGDCGDNGKMGVKREEVIELLAQKRISLMGFQVRNKSTDSYQTFNTQLTYLMKMSLVKRFELQAQANNTISKANVLATVLNDGWKIANQNNKDLYCYIHKRNPVLNKDMDVTKLTSIMEEAIGDWKQQIEYLKAKVVEAGTGGFDINTDGDGSLTNALMEIIGKERFEKIKKSNALTSFRGWTYKKEPSSKRNYYKIVVFLPEPELKTLLQKLEPVYRVARERSNNRQPYYDAMVTLARSIVAQDKIKETSYKAIIAKAFGLDETNTDFGGPRLADIVDPNVVSQQDYLNMVNKMVKSYTKLQQISSSTYPYTYNILGGKDKYYWLPSEYLPL